MKRISLGGRRFGLDAVRTAAILLVLLLHAIAMTDVMTDYVGRKIWYSFLYLHQLGIACVPLFLMLTGYLNREKKLSAGYFRGLSVTALSYICICIIGLVISHLRGEIITFGSAVHSIFNFTANGSAWYFEMYVVLYLLIPFINLVWIGLRGDGNGAFGRHLTLIIIFALLTVAPTTLRAFSPYYADGSGIALDVLPDYFENSWCITYYYIGCMFAEYPPKIKPAVRVAAAVSAPLLPVILVSLYTGFRGKYAWYMCNDFSSLTTALTACTVFVLFIGIDSAPEVLRVCTGFVARYAFEIYLFSYIWDNIAADYTRPLGAAGLSLHFASVFAFSLASALLMRGLLFPVIGLLKGS